MPRFVDVDGRRIAYARRDGRMPRVVFLGGLRSDMTGTKATFLDAWAAERGQAFLRLDYSGHGASCGEFADGRIGHWLADALGVIEAVGEEPLVLVGSSLGGWIALLAARRLGKRVRGVQLIAPAPDFTERLIWEALTPSQRVELERTGRMMLPASAPGEEPLELSQEFLTEARAHLLLTGTDPIPVRAPVRILHGMKDKDVSWELSLELAGRLTSDDVALCLVREGDHRLSCERALLKLKMSLEELLQRIAMTDSPAA